MFSSVRKSYVVWFNITVALSCDWNGWGGGGGGGCPWHWIGKFLVEGCYFAGKELPSLVIFGCILCFVSFDSPCKI